MYHRETSMEELSKPISRALEELKENLSEVARVSEWCELMGYNSVQNFTYHFIKYYGDRPHKYLVYIRLESIISELRNNCKSNLQIARDHSLPEEKALNNFTNYYLGHSPTDLKRMQEMELRSVLNNSFSDIQEQF